MGTTFIADLAGCKRNFVEAEAAKKVLLSVIEKAGMTPIGETSVTVSDGVNSGATAIVVVVPLKESHFALHTWPELGYAMLDFTTCGDADKGREAFMSLVRWFEPARVVPHEHERLL